MYLLQYGKIYASFPRLLADSHVPSQQWRLSRVMRVPFIIALEAPEGRREDEYSPKSLLHTCNHTHNYNNYMYLLQYGEIYASFPRVLADSHVLSRQWRLSHAMPL